MSVHGAGQTALEYYPCRYGASRVLFRGPKRDLDKPYIAFVGGTETYGRFIQQPFPALVERRLGLPCANFGVVNAGVDLYLNDPVVMGLVVGAHVKVVQVMGAQNMSNRYYSVHPRRNDRFLKASERLETLYPEVDFTEFHFVRHMLGRLHDLSDDRFSVVVDELRQAWIARMKNVLTQIRGRVVLLWFADQPIPSEISAPNAHDPLFVTREMIETLRPRVSTVIEAVPGADTLKEGTSGMVFSDFDACAAEELMGPAAHGFVADTLCEQLNGMLG